MQKNFNYFLHRNSDTNEIVYIEYENLKGYKITPKIKQEDAISVNKIVIVNPSMIEKIIKKKIEHKINYLIKILKTIDEEDSSGEGIRKSLIDAERLKLMILNTYVKYLGHTYQSLTIEKINLIIKEFRTRLYVIKEKEVEKFYMPVEEELDIEEKKGKGR